MTQAQRDGVEPCSGVDLALTRVFALLGKRWTGLVVAVLNHQPAHFAELRRAITGISERMLSDRLTELADAGLVTREVNPGPPLRVRYALTDAGHALGPALEELQRWAERHLPEGSVSCPGQAGECGETADVSAGPDAC
jgi:DNA-binding HxlR family transcriptional regulator